MKSPLYGHGVMTVGLLLAPSFCSIVKQTWIISDVAVAVENWNFKLLQLSVLFCVATIIYVDAKKRNKRLRENKIREESHTGLARSVR